jgi:hypothetical protein
MNWAGTGAQTEGCCQRIHVSLTEKGIKLRDRLITMHERHAAMLSRAALSLDDLQGAGGTLRQLERFWLRSSDLMMMPKM